MQWHCKGAEIEIKQFPASSSSLCSNSNGFLRKELAGKQQRLIIADLVWMAIEKEFKFKRSEFSQAAEALRNEKDPIKAFLFQKTLESIDRSIGEHYLFAAGLLASLSIATVTMTANQRQAITTDTTAEFFINHLKALHKAPVVPMSGKDQIMTLLLPQQRKPQPPGDNDALDAILNLFDLDSIRCFGALKNCEFAKNLATTPASNCKSR